MKSPMYSEFAKEYDKAIRDNIFNAHLERPSLLSMLPELKGKSVLDLACGPGVYAEYLVKQGAKVTAVDVSDEMVSSVNQKLTNQVNCYVQDLAFGLPGEADNQYDVIICPLAVHYLNHLNVLFTDIQRCLKSNGVFVFSTHHPMVDFTASPSGNYFKRELIVEQWDTLGHPVEVQFYRRSLTELIGSISAAGMCVVDLYEGKPSERMAEINPEFYMKLSNQPNFVFIKCVARP